MLKKAVLRLTKPTAVDIIKDDHSNIKTEPGISVYTDNSFYCTETYKHETGDIVFGKMFSALDVAKYIIRWCNEHDIQITNLKLQKLLYFLQGDYCKYTGKRLIADDFYAWQLGPVIPTVYSEYSIYAATNIRPSLQPPQIDKDTEEMIDLILYDYAFIPAWELVNLSHEQDPWKYSHEIWGNNAFIPYESIENFFTKGTL